ncbi:hypothetical protein BDZ89DRAFT_1075507 [Hymenopellis radicata]|nr:hypothetical protein BDZ89DRAFT_1075507 [Hymenopellis radicata]
MTFDFHNLDAARRCSRIVASRESRASGKSQGLDFAQRILSVVLVITILVRPNVFGTERFKNHILNDLSATPETMAVISKVISSCVCEASFLDVI